MKPDEKQIAQWHRVYKQGRSRFIWVRGVLGWGVPTAIVWSAIMAWSEGWTKFLQLLPIALITFPIGGYFWGAWMWKWLLKKMPINDERPETSEEHEHESPQGVRG